MLTCNFQIPLKCANFPLSIPPGKVLGKQLFCDRWWKGQWQWSWNLHCLCGRLGNTGETQGSDAAGHQSIYRQCRAISCSSCYQETQGLWCPLGQLQASSTPHAVVWGLMKQVAHLPVSPVQIYARLRSSGTLLSAQLLPRIPSSKRPYSGSAQGPSSPLACLRQ